MDSWYPTWETTLADAVEELGLDRDIATQHCKESKSQLLQATGECKTNKELAEAVRTIVAYWPSRYACMLGDSGVLEKIQDQLQAIANKKPPDVIVHNMLPQALAPNVTVTNEVMTPNINVTNEVKTPNVTVTNEVKTPSVSITNEVKTPNVTVTNEVAPAAVDVNVTLPARKTRTTVTRDNKGAITGSEQTEEDL
jgi:hypothetical protein